MKQQIQEILIKMEAHNRQRLLFTRILCILCALVTVCSLVVMVTVSRTAASLTELVPPILELSGQAQAVMADLDTAAKELAKADLTGLVNQMQAIDTDTLNKAIQDLAEIVEPLAEVRNFFGG